MRKLALITAAAALMFAVGGAAIADEGDEAVILKCSEDVTTVTTFVGNDFNTDITDIGEPVVRFFSATFGGDPPAGCVNGDACVQCLKVLWSDFDCEGGEGVTSEGDREVFSTDSLDTRDVLNKFVLRCDPDDDDDDDDDD